MDAAWSAGDSPVVGVVDREADPSDARETVEELESVLADADATIVTGGLDAVLAAEPSVLVTVDEAALSAVARTGVETPVLPVGPVTGMETVDRDRVPDAVMAMLEGRAVHRSRPVFGVTLEPRSRPETESGTEPETDRTESGTDRYDIGGGERALFDVTLVTDEPARISEYGVRSRDASVATFRADGVVAATPAGSHGYASAVDAPSLSAGVDAAAVAPIGPFVTQTRRWVLPNDDLVFTVEREESDVTLVVDGRAVGTVSVDSRVVVSLAGTLPTLVVPDDRLEG
ncbi:ATP-NAD kinase [Natrinema sp. CBA1119]|uniref:NAD(+)/NADH kinase n=1 Tax=Natrinema sp. CBA1119 TaxID=1608465 RepID=UPI000BF4501E|nr:NAD(+)/NADH kinase [Natrinema sp. CBA1119]PGF15147.1 ATP-NAD kinase [Natrinema sp. CBA1119]